MFVERLHPLTSSRLVVIGQDATVQEAALSLSRPGIGLVVVSGAGGSLQGVLSKSDLIRHLSRAAHSSSQPAASMSKSVITCGPRDDLHDVWQTMATRNLQNVVDDDAKPLGLWAEHFDVPISDPFIALRRRMAGRSAVQAAMSTRDWSN